MTDKIRYRQYQEIMVPGDGRIGKVVGAWAGGQNGEPLVMRIDFDDGAFGWYYYETLEPYMEWPLTGIPPPPLQPRLSSLPDFFLDSSKPETLRRPRPRPKPDTPNVDGRVNPPSYPLHRLRRRCYPDRLWRRYIMRRFQKEERWLADNSHRFWHGCRHPKRPGEGMCHICNKPSTVSRPPEPPAPRRRNPGVPSWHFGTLDSGPR